jgi:hypothetical protein
MIAHLFFPLLILFSPQDFPDHELHHGDSEWSVYGPAVIDEGGVGVVSRSAPIQSVTTEVHDPTYPNEPWVVVTHRRNGESLEAWLGRHRGAIDAIRDILET